jgi:hypothetical protein
MLTIFDYPDRSVAGKRALSRPLFSITKDYNFSFNPMVGVIHGTYQSCFC